VSSDCWGLDRSTTRDVSYSPIKSGQAVLQITSGTNVDSGLRRHQPVGRSLYQLIYQRLGQGRQEM